MSFSDLLTSARGPGVIGMLMALFVLIGFGTLFMFAFDEGSMGSGKSLAAQIRDSEKTITTEKVRIVDGEKTLETIPTLKKTSTDLRESKTKEDFLNARITHGKSEIKELKAGIKALEEEHADYKNQYRAFVRNNAAGTQIEELKTLTGEVYNEVDVRKVTAVGIEIRHRDGHKRIAFEVLPEEMQDYYQFDKGQMLAEVQREATVREKHNAEVAVAQGAAEGQAAMGREKDKEEARQKAVGVLAAKEASLQTIEQEIRQLQSELLSSENAANAARAAGRMHLSKSGGIRGRINSKRAEYTRVQGEIARLQSSL